MNYCGMFSFVCAFAVLIIVVLVYLKMRRESNENYVKFPQPDMRRLKGSVECAYALNGGSVAYCNEWLDANRKGLQCANDGFKICCDKALTCCNQIATCGGGKDCRNPIYTPTKDNNLMYDENEVIDA